MSIEYQKIIFGQPSQCIVRVKPPVNYQKEDVQILVATEVGIRIKYIKYDQKNYRKNPYLLFQNKVIQQYQVSEVYGPEHSVTAIFDSVFRPYLSPFSQGFNCTFYAMGSTGSGKSSFMQGYQKQPGLILLMMDGMFNMLETKKYHTNTNQSGATQNYSYGIRIRYLELLDEEFQDLLGRGVSSVADNLAVVENAWEGPTISHATWVAVSNSMQVHEILSNGSQNRNMTSNQFGKMGTKATAIFSVDLLQTSQLVDTNENLVLISRMNFIDLPGNEVLLEDPESLRLKQGSTINKSMMGLGALLQQLSFQRLDFTQFENSALTHLMKDPLGGNCLTVGIFCLQHGDSHGSQLTMNFLKHAQSIQTFPIINDQKAFGLLKRFRSEIMATKQMKLKSQNDSNNEENMNDFQKNILTEKKLIESNLDKLRVAEQKQRIQNQLTQMREKCNEMIREKGQLQNELIQSEEQQLDVSRALVQLQIQNTRLMELIQNEQYDINQKLLHAEGQLIVNNVKEERAMKIIQEIQDQMKAVQDEKKTLEIEFVALKKNYIQKVTMLEEEQLQNQNIGVEMINLMNENKALTEEINLTYQQTGKQTEENSRFSNKMERLEQENEDQREALLFARAEVEQLQTDMLKYQMRDQQHQIEIDYQKIQLERGFMEVNQDKQDEIMKIHLEADRNLQRAKEQRLLWESQRLELVQKTKTSSRQIHEQDDKIMDLTKANEALQAENNRLTLQLDEMRTIFRNQLIQFTTDSVKNSGGNENKPLRVGYDLNAREELIRTYTEKEIQLTERVEKQKKLVRTLKVEISSKERKFFLQFIECLRHPKLLKIIREASNIWLKIGHRLGYLCQTFLLENHQLDLKKKDLWLRKIRENQKE